MKWKHIIKTLLEENQDISEIETNGSSSVFYKENGKRKEWENVFFDEDDYNSSILELINMIKPGTEKVPQYIEEGRIRFLNGQARVHIVLPPACDYPLVTIARKSKQLSTLESIASKGSFSTKMLNFIKAAVDINATMVIVGPTGAGKGLHIDEIIPTPTGLKKVKDIKVGDTVYTEKGELTKIKGVYNPPVEDHYEIDFSNGVLAKFDGSHLWKLSNGEVVETRNLDKQDCFSLKSLNGKLNFKKQTDEQYVFSKYDDILQIKDFNIYNYSLEERETIYNIVSKHCTQYNEVELYSKNRDYALFIMKVYASLGYNPMYLTRLEDTYVFTCSEDDNVYIDSIKNIKDNPEDYRCFQVDNPEKLFLFSDMFIPTHNTTFLEATTKEWNDNLRIGVVEDSPELSLKQPNVVYLHSSVWSPGMDPNSVATLDWCVKQLNRQRVDKIIVGEVRGKEAFDFIVAANSGCEGSMITIHANDPRSALQKLTQFVIIGMPQPVRLANQSISKTVDLIIQLGFDDYGKHKITHIEEVTETLGNSEDAPITTTTLFSFDKKTSSHIDNSVLMSVHLRNRFEKAGYSIQTFKKGETEEYSGVFRPRMR